MVMLEFAYGTDLDKASQSINDNLNLVADFFPDDASQPTIFKLNTNMMPVMNIALRSSSGKDANELRALMENVIQNQIDRVGGVSNTSINGGQDAIVQVAIDQNRLEAYGVTLSQVSFALNPQNVQVGAGTMVEGDLSYLLRTDAEFSSLEEIENVMIMSIPSYDNTGTVTGSSVIRLKDLATVSYAFRDATSQVYINGEPGVYLSVSKESDANTVQVAKRVHELIDQLTAELPDDLSLEVIVDTSTMVESTINAVYESLLYGVILVMVVLFIFLRSFKSTLIIGVAIPISMLLTVLSMFFLGYSLNLMTLTGLILGLGMTVDSSIVVLENVFRYRERGAKLHAAAILGTKEMIVSIVAS
ncbi:MAG: efflux RND transporter permease subunit, partial [Candidatus Bathyarchaeota archaeon]|nr:efflux RND transporter permease subunit [Candidatus Bathyarchaeota archaeon]